MRLVVVDAVLLVAAVDAEATLRRAVALEFVYPQRVHYVGVAWHSAPIDEDPRPVPLVSVELLELRCRPLDFVKFHCLRVSAGCAVVSGGKEAGVGVDGVEGAVEAVVGGVGGCRVGGGVVYWPGEQHSGRALCLGEGWEEEAGQGYCFGVALAESEMATVGAGAGWLLDGRRRLWDLARRVVHRGCRRKWRRRERWRVGGWNDGYGVDGWGW